MAKSTKPHDGSSDARLPDFVVEDVDDLLFELREFLRTYSLANLKSVSCRQEALQEIARMLQRFTTAIKHRINDGGDETVLKDLFEELLNGSDSQNFELCLANIGTPAGKKKLEKHLSQLPFPRYESNPEDSTTVVQVLADGTRTIGKFVDRKFIPVGHD